MFVSHDQYLIDQLSNSIIELDSGKVSVYSMNYMDYLSQKERKVEGQARDWVMEEKTIKRLRKSLEILRVKAMKSSGDATYRQTKRRFNEMKDNHGRKPVLKYNTPKIQFSSSVDRKGGKVLVSIKDMSFSYGEKQVFNDVTENLVFGEKVILFGNNGSGKSTLIKLITEELKPQKGSVKIGNDVRWQLMTQDHLEGLDQKETVLSVFGNILNWREGRCRACLSKYGIEGDLVHKQIGVLSGGQQARFKLAVVFSQDPEFLILDEPTNHIDPPTWEVVVNAIKEYSGTVLVVTHDRDFIDSIADKLWVLRNGKIKVEYGNLTDYLENK
jgi:ATP-binding cassette subfamily F protein 3